MLPPTHRSHVPPKTILRFFRSASATALLAAFAVVVSPHTATATTSGTKPASSPGSASGAKTANSSAKKAAPKVTVTQTPFSTYLDFTPSEQTRNRNLIETKIAACMKKQGFTYIARTSEPITRDESVNPTDAYKLVHGYGIADALELLAKPAAKSIDPNDDVRKKMSPEERRAYDIAFLGKEIVEQAAGSKSPPAVPSGCQADATKFLEKRNSMLQAFSPKLRAFEDSFEKDQRVVKARADWSACMSKSGYQFPHPAVVVGAIAARFDLDQITSQSNKQVAPTEKGSVAKPATAKTVPPATLKQIREEELAIAKIDVACSKGVNDKIRDTRIELEKAFIAKHQIEFDTLRSAKDS